MNTSCYLCEKQPRVRDWDQKILAVIHHILPRQYGGTDNDENLIVLCTSCHRRLHNFNSEIALRQVLSNDPKFFEKTLESYKSIMKDEEDV